MITTTIEVTCSQIGKVQPYTGIVKAELQTKVFRTNGIEVGYRYLTADDELLMSGATTYEWNEVNSLWDLVKDVISENATFEEMINIAFEQAFKIEVASTFGITVNDFE